MSETTIFFSYSRDDSGFVLKLAQELRDAGADVWLDQLDIKPGSRWDRSIEKALDASKTVLVILSKTSVASHNVMDEVSYAMEEGKKIVPVLFEECDIPFRIRRFHFADFTSSHQKGISSLIDALGLEEKVVANLTHEEDTIPQKTESTSQSPPLPDPEEIIEKVPEITEEPEQDEVESEHSKEKEPSTTVKDSANSLVENNETQDDNGSAVSKTPQKKSWKKSYFLTSFLLFNIFSLVYFVIAGLSGFISGSKASYFFEIGLYSLISSVILVGLGALVNYLRKAKNSAKEFGVALLRLYNVLFIIWHIYGVSETNIKSTKYRYIRDEFNATLLFFLLIAFIVAALLFLFKRYRKRTS
jgi:hypothetical protein